ncbi:uncharacterized protein NEPG_00938 [Nematocida parisii ERTm1]|uniref:uncharacterized protein n=1 Tax=Nematocida parisii (strain ERTm1 / ATCC PRA-289) TaxID=881290 RepID=UPI000264BA85|nr:uncharacterized protein NEPG_00938 [Nematocida parisii ERTm1]EIJ94271.1 hypothetical protein NEPG_00938 [Nematocida parisii ERTm1]|eukprot:XP_013058767.1 hypothetical protein NEPG_00938 [Nematocida parisii ERTm1]
MDINEQKLRAQIQRAFSKSNENLMCLEDIQDRLITIVLNVYKKDDLHNEKYTNLNNLAYNVFISLIVCHTYIIKEINEHTIINIINESMRISDTFINNIKASDVLNTNKSAIYNLLNNLHIYTALPNTLINSIKDDIHMALYLHRRDNNQKEPDYSQKYAMRYLCKPHVSGKCSNFERVLDIITANISNFTTCNYKSNVLRSNIHNLDLSDDDIQLLSLFVSCYTEDIYRCMQIMNHSIIIESKKITKSELKKEFQNSHIKKVLDLPILRELISSTVEFIKKGTRIIEKVPGLKDKLDHMVKFLKGFYNVSKLSGVNFMVSHAPGVKSKLIKSVCDCLPVYMEFNCMHGIVYLLFAMDKAMCTYTGIINGLIKLGLYTYQEYDVCINYNDYTHEKLKNLCYSYNMDIDEFNENVVVPRAWNIKNQISMIFNEPLNMPLNNILNTTIQDIKPLGHKNKCFKPVDSVIDSISAIDIDMMLNNPFFYGKDHDIMINIESIEDTSNPEVSKTESIIMDEYTPGTYQNNPSTETLRGCINSSGSKSSIKFHDDSTTSAYEPQTNYSVQAEVTSVVNDLIAAVSDPMTNYPGIHGSIPVADPHVQIDIPVINDPIPDPHVQIDIPVINDPIPDPHVQIDIPVVNDPVADPHVQIDIPVVNDPVTNSYITDLFNRYIIYVLLLILLLITASVLYYNNILVFV